MDGRYTRLSGIQKRVSRIVARRADACIVVSEHMKKNLPAPVEAQVIPSGIDFQFFKPVPQKEARKRLGLPLDERLVLFVGRPTQARKRFELSKRAVEILNERLAARLIVGWRIPHADIPLYMSAADALIFTSMQEGSPNVVKEALACNLPVVSVAVGDVAERIREIEGCELCVDERPETIAAALERVLKRKQRIKGREAVRNLDENLITKSVINIYQSVLQNQRVSENRQMMSRVSQAGR
jgi:glycosyltransferase involved in cell wall biosynthesis